MPADVEPMSWELGAVTVAGGTLVGLSAGCRVVVDVPSAADAKASFDAAGWPVEVRGVPTIRSYPVEDLYFIFGGPLHHDLPKVPGFVLDPSDQRTFTTTGWTSIRARPTGGIDAASLRILKEHVRTNPSSPPLLRIEPRHEFRLVPLEEPKLLTGGACADRAAVDAVHPPPDGRPFTSETTVALLDSGVDREHPDLKPNVAETGANFTGDGAQPTVDRLGHGTWIAGIIAGVRGNQIGTDGIGWRTRLLPVKVTRDGGSMAADGQIADAIRFAIDSGARVINASWGVDCPCTNLDQAIRDANRANPPVIVVAASGNDGKDINPSGASPFYPASFGGTEGHENVVAVLATWTPDSVASERFSALSNFGVPTVFIGAPGVDICSTWRGNSIAEHSGTSGAAAFVSGGISLMLSRDPKASLGEIREKLRSDGSIVPSLDGKCASGKRMDLERIR